MSVTQQPFDERGAVHANGQPSATQTRRAVWRAFWTSRLMVLLSGMLAVIQFGLAPGAAAAFDPASLTSPFGYFGNLLVAPLARWDSVWYLSIARWGYGNPERMNFFPLYPILIRVLAVPARSPLVAGVVISLVCFLIAMVVLYRLVCLDFDEEIAAGTLLLLAFFPVSLFFSAVYTESLFLALAVGCVYCARRGRWAWAGVLGFLAALCRSDGVLLVVPFAVLFLYGPRADRNPKLTRWFAAGGPRLGWWTGSSRAGWRGLLPRYALTWRAWPILLIPLGLGSFLLYLGLHYGMALEPFRAQEKWWFHKATWPFGGVWQGLVAAWDGLRQVLHGPAPPNYFTPNGGNALLGASYDLELFAFLIPAIVGFFCALRLLPIAYSAYTLISLALPLSDPVTPEPLASINRYELVIFPLFIWAAAVCVRRRWLLWAVAACAVLLGYFSAQFATWRFVA